MPLLLGITFILLSIIFGLAISMLLETALTLEERLCFSILAGNAVSTLLVYLLSSLQQKLDSLSIVVGLITLSLASILIVKEKKRLGGKPIERGLNLEIAFVALAGFVAFLVLNLRCVLREEFGAVYGSLFVNGDYAFHLSVIGSFVFRDNFPPQYPVMVDTPMKYPIMVDFLSSILMKTGLPEEQRDHPERAPSGVDPLSGGLVRRQGGQEEVCGRPLGVHVLLRRQPGNYLCH
jgi:hypothetical protein